VSFEISQLLKEAIAHEKAGNYHELTLVGQKAVQMYPKEPEAHYILGRCHMKSGEYELAANSFKNATSKKPDYAKAYYYRTECLLLLGHIDSAFSEWTLLSGTDQDLSASLQQDIFKSLMS
jgi:tetratricopeptide (TPR) repeat protein